MTIEVISGPVGKENREKGTFYFFGSYRRRLPRKK
jgi:hypothetical protein